jgi:hypothetical protein
MTRDRHEAAEDTKNVKPVWNPISLKKDPVIKEMHKKYRDANDITKRLQTVLKDELQARLEKRHENLLAEEPDKEIKITFNWGKLAYAIVSTDDEGVKKSPKNAVTL